MSANRDKQSISTICVYVFSSHETDEEEEAHINLETSQLHYTITFYIL